ncbi:MAG: hypothetical protein MR902_03365 [Campylobacter sp.]|nr:hypothetical protein [Campylobacter sp.]
MKNNRIWLFFADDLYTLVGCFYQKELAEINIRRHKLSGTLIAYPINMSIFDLLEDSGYMKACGETSNTLDSKLIKVYIDKSLEHSKYKNGKAI